MTRISHIVQRLPRKSLVVQSWLVAKLRRNCVYVDFKCISTHTKHIFCPQHVDSKISMTFDTWTSLSGDPFLSITAHYIDTPVNKPQQWILKLDQLAFTPIVGNHSGTNIGKILMEVIDEYDIRKKVYFRSQTSSY